MYLKNKQLSQTIADAEKYRLSIDAEALLESHFVYAVLSNDAALMSMISGRLGLTADHVAMAIKNGHYAGSPYSTELEERAADTFLQNRPTQPLSETHVFLTLCREHDFSSLLLHVGLDPAEFARECYGLTGRGKMLHPD